MVSAIKKHKVSSLVLLDLLGIAVGLLLFALFDHLGVIIIIAHPDTKMAEINC